MTSARYTELELSSEIFDRPSCPVRAKVFICATGRTGSWLLCRAMIHHGIGLPHEYFNARHIGLIGHRFGIHALADGSRLGSDSEPRRAYIAALVGLKLGRQGETPGSPAFIDPLTPRSILVAGVIEVTIANPPAASSNDLFWKKRLKR